jgi:hypothetical protein
MLRQPEKSMDAFAWSASRRPCSTMARVGVANPPQTGGDGGSKVRLQIVQLKRIDPSGTKHLLHPLKGSWEEVLRQHQAAGE